MTKIAINTAIGGFGISKQAFEMLIDMENPGAVEEAHLLEEFKKNELMHNLNCGFPCWNISRDDPQLIEVIEHLGEKANSDGCKLKIVEIPDDVEWYIFEDECGEESIHEKHRIWN